jgi:hypothetical protein
MLSSDKSLLPSLPLAGMFAGTENDVAVHMCTLLPLKDLLRVSEVNKPSYYAALRELFRRETKEACQYQENLMCTWLIMIERGEIPLFFQKQNDLSFLISLKKLSVSPIASFAHRLLSCRIMAHLLNKALPAPDKSTVAQVFETYAENIPHHFFTGTVSFLKNLLAIGGIASLEPKQREEQVSRILADNYFQDPLQGTPPLPRVSRRVVRVLHYFDPYLLDDARRKILGSDEGALVDVNDFAAFHVLRQLTSIASWKSVFDQEFQKTPQQTSADDYRADTQNALERELLSFLLDSSEPAKLVEVMLSKIRRSFSLGILRQSTDAIDVLLNVLKACMMGSESMLPRLQNEASLIFNQVLQYLLIKDDEDGLYFDKCYVCQTLIDGAPWIPEIYVPSTVSFLVPHVLDEDDCDTFYGHCVSDAERTEDNGDVVNIFKSFKQLADISETWRSEFVKELSLAVQHPECLPNKSTSSFEIRVLMYEALQYLAPNNKIYLQSLAAYKEELLGTVSSDADEDKLLEAASHLSRLWPLFSEQDQRQVLAHFSSLLQPDQLMRLADNASGYDSDSDSDNEEVGVALPVDEADQRNQGMLVLCPAFSALAKYFSEDQRALFCKNMRPVFAKRDAPLSKIQEVAITFSELTEDALNFFENQFSLSIPNNQAINSWQAISDCSIIFSNVVEVALKAPDKKDCQRAMTLLGEYLQQSMREGGEGIFVDLLEYLEGYTYTFGEMSFGRLMQTAAVNQCQPIIAHLMSGKYVKQAEYRLVEVLVDYFLREDVERPKALGQLLKNLMNKLDPRGNPSKFVYEQIMRLNHKLSDNDWFEAAKLMFTPEDQAFDESQLFEQVKVFVTYEDEDEEGDDEEGDAIRIFACELLRRVMPKLSPSVQKDILSQEIDSLAFQQFKLLLAYRETVLPACDSAIVEHAVTERAAHCMSP